MTPDSGAANNDNGEARPDPATRIQTSPLIRVWPHPRDHQRTSGTSLREKRWPSKPRLSRRPRQSGRERRQHASRTKLDIRCAITRAFRPDSASEHGLRVQGRSYDFAVQRSGLSLIGRPSDSRLILGAPASSLRLRTRFRIRRRSWSEASRQAAISSPLRRQPRQSRDCASSSQMPMHGDGIVPLRLSSPTLSCATYICSTRPSVGFILDLAARKSSPATSSVGRCKIRGAYCASHKRDIAQRWATRNNGKKRVYVALVLSWAGRLRRGVNELIGLGMAHSALGLEPGQIYDADPQPRQALLSAIRRRHWGQQS